MFGKYITIEGNAIRIWCTPRTPDEELHARAKRKLELYRSGTIKSLD